jgi:Mn-dependent DtxR family transcriptional regulator
VLREISKEEATNEIRRIFSSGKTLYYSDIAKELGLDLELVVDICNELQKQGDITIDARVS